MSHGYLRHSKKKGSEAAAASTGGVDVEWTDTLHVTDSQRQTLSQPETLHLTDVQKQTLALPDTLHLTDSRVAPTGVTVTATKTDTLHLTEGTVVAQFADVLPYGDAYTVEGAGNPGADTVTLLVINNGPATTGHDAYLKINLRNDAGGVLNGLTARANPNDTIVLRIVKTANGALVDQDYTVTSLIQDADPWTESGITFANAPEHNTSEGTINVSAGNDRQERTLTLTTRMGTAIGNWLSIRIRDGNALSTTTATFASSENATTADRPTFTFHAERTTP